MHQEQEGHQFGDFEIQAMARVPNREHEERCTESRLMYRLSTTVPRSKSVRLADGVHSVIMLFPTQAMASGSFQVRSISGSSYQVCFGGANRWATGIGCVECFIRIGEDAEVDRQRHRQRERERERQRQ